MQNPIVLQQDQKIQDTTIQLLVKSDERGYISISHGRWVQQNMPEHCTKINEWNVKAKLYFGNNKYPRIVKDIYNIKFPFIKQINLWGNLIQSFESLSRIYWPSLNNFSINGNLLVECKSFRKFDMIGLKSLGLSFNKILELSVLPQFNSNKLTRVIIEFQGDSEMCSDISWQSKLQSPLKDLYIMSGQRISQNEVKNCLRRLNPDLVIRS